MKVYQFDPQIYPRKLWVAVGVPTEELNEKFVDEIKDMDDSNDAETLPIQQKEPLLGGVLVRFENLKSMRPDNIAHEATHAALEIFDYVDARIQYDNQEPFAYLVGWVVKCIDEVKTAMQING